jgi:HEAT repeat protein
MSTGALPSGHGAVRWLVAQSVSFGIVAALLGVVANTMFLEAYGAQWLPLTYVVIGAAGAAVSVAVARSARRYDLVRIAVVVLGATAVLLLAAWVATLGGGGAWVSGPLLVLFPVLIQLGFVFIGAQAGRVLDIAGIKARFPRIVAGFPVGAVVGGLLAAPLVDLLGSTEGLLVATALAQAVFTALVVVTGVRYAGFLAVAPTPSSAATAGSAAEEPAASLGLRRLLATRFVALILGYQVLSALASQLSDYLVFDRAAAQFPDPDDLARFLGGYTAVMNAVSIGFLVLLAGPLMRRYGLRLGISANPVVLLAASVVILVVLGVSGGASVALLVAVSAARVLDIALTDGTTRTSINAMYQVLPERLRLPAQATIEGTGVPVAISASGLLVLALNALPSPLTTIVVTTVLVCAAWVWTGVLLHRAYGPALVDVLRERRLLDDPVALGGATADLRTAERLFESPDPRSARLGLELVSALAAPAQRSELAFLADDPRPWVRLSVLQALAGPGTEARAALADEVRAAQASDEPDLRARAALALSSLDDVDRLPLLGRLLGDPVATVRTAALDAVRHRDDAFVRSVVGALDDPGSTVAAGDAVGRLADAALPAADEALLRASSAQPDSLTTLRAVRIARALTTGSDARNALLTRWAGHPDREVGCVVLQRLAVAGPASTALARVVDDVLATDVAHAAEVLGALVALRAEPGTAPGPPGDPASTDGEHLLCEALADELTLVRSRVLAALLARHGTQRLGPVAAALTGGGGSAPLAIEALEVVLGASVAARLTPVLDTRNSPEDRLHDLVARTGTAVSGGGAQAVLTDLVEDPRQAWRSTWVRACAVRASCDGGLAGTMDLAPARALADPMVDEELDRIR